MTLGVWYLHPEILLCSIIKYQISLSLIQVMSLLYSPTETVENFKKSPNIVRIYEIRAKKYFSFRAKLLTTFF